MNAKSGAAFLIAFAVVLGVAPVCQAQDPSSTQQSTDHQDKEKLTPEKKAFLLLDLIISEAGGLKLPENRIYIQISAGDLMWDRDEP